MLYNVLFRASAMLAGVLFASYCVLHVLHGLEHAALSPLVGALQ